MSPGEGTAGEHPGAPRSEGTQPVRIDVWLVAVRLAKTRSIASKACRAGHVTIDGQQAKPATPVAIGDRVEVRLAQRDRIVEVVRLITKRTSAPIAQTCYIDHSPPAEPRTPTADFAVRERGSGRPTKRDRRQIDRLRGR